MDLRSSLEYVLTQLIAGWDDVDEMTKRTVETLSDEDMRALVDSVFVDASAQLLGLTGDGHDRLKEALVHEHIFSFIRPNVAYIINQPEYIADQLPVMMMV